MQSFLFVVFNELIEVAFLRIFHDNVEYVRLDKRGFVLNYVGVAEAAENLNLSH